MSRWMSIEFPVESTGERVHGSVVNELQRGGLQRIEQHGLHSVRFNGEDACRGRKVRLQKTPLCVQKRLREFAAGVRDQH